MMVIKNLANPPGGRVLSTGKTGKEMTNGKQELMLAIWPYVLKSLASHVQKYDIVIEISQANTGKTIFQLMRWDLKEAASTVKPLLPNKCIWHPVAARDKRESLSAYGIFYNSN